MYQDLQIQCCGYESCVSINFLEHCVTTLRPSVRFFLLIFPCSCRNRRLEGPGLQARLLEDFRSLEPPRQHNPLAIVDKLGSTQSVDLRANTSLKGDLSRKRARKD